MLLRYAAPPIKTIVEKRATPNGRRPLAARETWGSSKLKGGKLMRMLLRVSIPVETGNAAAKAGTLGSTVEKIVADLKPEAAYFFPDDNGQRSGSIVFDMKDSSQIPAIAEPWFLAFNAKISLRPVMNPQDLAAAGPSITKAGQQYGK